MLAGRCDVGTLTMKNTIKRGVNRRKLQAIARACDDHRTTDSLDRAIARGAVTEPQVKRIATSCSDHITTDALDALVS